MPLVKRVSAYFEGELQGIITESVVVFSLSGTEARDSEWSFFRRAIPGRIQVTATQPSIKVGDRDRMAQRS